MNNKCFIQTLNKLKDSSQESVESFNTLDSFKSYIHVDREPLQEKYFTLLNESSKLEKAQLILVCGSSGDGKSHVTSYVYNENENIKQNFEVHNDATESYNPTDDNIDTLNKILNDFSDENIELSNKKLILLINLGTLNNFINSKYKHNFKKLKSFVEQNYILENKISENNFDESRYFQYISFSDYNIYTLTAEGANSKYIYELIDKVTNKNEKNPFYKSYVQSCSECSVASKCTIKKNYELLSNEVVTEQISKLIIECVIKYKMIIPTRHVLNFIYTIIVSSSISELKDKKLYKYIDTLKDDEYIELLLPNLLFNSKDRSIVLKYLSKLDPMVIRNEALDQVAIEFFVANNKKNVYNKYLGAEISNNLIDQQMDEIKVDNLYKLLIRTMRLVNLENQELFIDWIYSRYIKDLFNINTGEIKKLKETNNDILNVIYKWNGNNEEKNKMNISLGNKQFNYIISEELEIKPYIKNINKNNMSKEKELSNFISTLNLKFWDGKDENTVESIDIDFTLYDLIMKIKEGYVPNKLDKTQFINIDSFINKLSDLGNKKNELFVFDNQYNTPKKYKLYFEETYSEFMFEEIR